MSLYIIQDMRCDRDNGSNWLKSIMSQDHSSRGIPNGDQHNYGNLRRYIIFTCRFLLIATKHTL